ncbi:MAG: D-aminoacyl-tRNA deacylase [Desulfuromonas thiophila]|uniref:D-aminoacyl-tRNA deacylase n=1 Tax=Desulfuromonas thiophila TaxID=57664 RepID=UPI0024A91916|nr:D-aminoacyl-tRNA deacylase [Desulfuromonas thiophila]MDD3801409.1 D-aminoacyl-tRNA deacylase [Desulfuromonas thiophila]
MKAVLQRVQRASVTVAERTVAAIGPGLLVLVGVAQGDTVDDVVYLADRIRLLRLFEDEAGKMNRSLEEVGGAVLLVSQFTLLADCRKGRRPGFSAAAPPDQAEQLYLALAARLREQAVAVATGIFQADMQVELVNDGPVTLLLDSRREN